MNAPRTDQVAAIATELGLLGRRLDALATELSAWQIPGRSCPVGSWNSRGAAHQCRTTPLPPVGPPYAVPYAGPPQPPPPNPGRRPALSAGAAAAARSPPPAACLARVPVRRPAPGLDRCRSHAARGRAAARPRRRARLVRAARAGRRRRGSRTRTRRPGLRLHRRPSSRTGALAVTGTGIATLYLVVAAATALYGYLPVPVGLLLALLVAAGGLALADRWRSALLASGAVVGAALLAPVVTERLSPLLVALVLVLQVAATAVALRRRWPVLAGIAAGWPVLYGTLVAGIAEPADRWGTAAAAAAVLLTGITAAAWTVRPEPLPRGLRIGLVVTAPLPALTFAAAVGDVPGAVLAFLAAVLLFAVAALPGRDHVLRVVALVAGAVALFEATSVAFDGNAETAALLGQGVVLLVVAAALRSRPALVVGGIVGLTGVLAAVAEQVPLEALASYPSAPFVLGITVQRPALVAAVAMSVLVLAAAVAALVGSARVGVLGADARAAWLWVPVGLVGLYGAAGLVIALALLASPTRAGFVAGHAVVTVSWVVVALVLLARGVRRPALRVAGLVLVGRGRRQAAAVRPGRAGRTRPGRGLPRCGAAAARGGDALRPARRRGRDGRGGARAGAASVG